MAIVKKKATALVKKSKLERAVERADDFMAGEITGVLKTMRDILKDPLEDSRARVQAGSKLMEWARPKKPVFAVQVNNNQGSPTVVSRLGLPSAPPTFAEAQALNVTALDKKIPKILPEPARSIGETLRPFSKTEVLPTELPIPVEVEMADPTPRPANMPNVKQIKPY